MTFSIDNPEGGCNNSPPPPPPLGKYVWEKPSGEQGLTERGRLDSRMSSRVTQGSQGWSPLFISSISLPLILFKDFFFIVGLRVEDLVIDF